MTLKKAEAELAEIDDEITKVMADYLSALYVDDVYRRLRGQW